MIVGLMLTVLSIVHFVKSFCRQGNKSAGSRSGFAPRHRLEDDAGSVPGARSAGLSPLTSAIAGCSL